MSDKEREAETGEGRAAGRSSGSILGAALAELVGTYMLVFFGTATVAGVLLAAAPGTPPDVTAISLAFGFAVLAVVYAFGHISGTHVNPAVTVGLAAARKFPLSAVPAYIAAQFVGAILASLTVWALFGAATGPATGAGAATAGTLVISLVTGFLAYLAGGYIAGMRAGSNGPLNGAMTAVFGLIVWIVLGLILVILGVVVSLISGGSRFPGASAILGIFAGGFLLGGYLGGKLGGPSGSQSSRPSRVN